jgi:hypothetical protein
VKRRKPDVANDNTSTVSRDANLRSDYVGGPGVPISASDTAQALADGSLHLRGHGRRIGGYFVLLYIAGLAAEALEPLTFQACQDRMVRTIWPYEK